MSTRKQRRKLDTLILASFDKLVTDMLRFAANGPTSNRQAIIDSAHALSDKFDEIRKQCFPDEEGTGN